jgi:Putative lumazine-binding
MRPAFHPDASFFGYAGDQLAIGTPFLFDWIDKNGPAGKIEPRMVSVDILESIAVVRLDVAGWSGKLAGSGVYMSDLFTLLKTPSGWKIIQKAFHWHS